MNYIDLLIKDPFKKIKDWATPLGPITYAVFKKTSPPDPEWWVGSFKFGKHPIGMFHSIKPVAAAGTSIFPEEALIRTIGEGIERYCSVNSHLIDKLQLQLADDSLGFIRCGAFEPCQDSFKKNTLEEPIEHSLVKRLTDGKEVLIPAEHVHLGFARRDLKKMLTSPISTGCAFYPDINAAIWRGICEVVERDAMMRFWHCKLKPVQLDTSTVASHNFQQRLKRISNAGLSIKIFEISKIAPIPTMYVILHSNEFPYFCVGAASDTNVIKACCKAIDESISIKIMANWNGYKKKEEHDLINFSWINSLEKHMELYANWKDSPAFDFFFNDSPVLSLEEIEKSRDWLSAPKSHDDLNQISHSFSKLGFEIYWKEITLPEAAEFGHVVKVIIPKMIPLSQTFSARWLAPFTDLSVNGTLNIYPHPFS